MSGPHLGQPGEHEPDTAFRAISRIDNSERDKYLLKRIEENPGQDKLVVFGGTHISTIQRVVEQKALGQR